jgi:hypothetical protein
MPDSVNQPEPTRVFQALLQVSQGVMEDVLQRARQYHTAIITADAQGRLQSHSPETFGQDVKGNDHA